MLLVHAACLCCISLLHVHAFYAVIAAFLCCMFMQHVHVACQHCMSTLHVHATCPCCTSLLDVPSCISVLHVKLHVNVVSPHYAMLHVYAICPRRLPMPMLYQYVLAACPCCMSVLHAFIHAACHILDACSLFISTVHVIKMQTWMSMLHVPAASICCISMLHVHTACPCCFSMLHEHRHVA